MSLAPFLGVQSVTHLSLALRCCSGDDPGEHENAFWGSVFTDMPKLEHLELDGEGGGPNAALSFVHLPLGGEHTDADETRDERPGLPWLLVYRTVLEDVRERDGVEREQALVPLCQA